MYSSLCCPLCDSFPLAAVPFIGCNLLLSHWVYIKAVLQAASHEKGCAASRCFPVALGQRTSSRAQRLSHPGLTALNWAGGGGKCVGVLETRKDSQACGKGSWGGEGEGKGWRAGGEEAHFWLKVVLSPPIISHCSVES